MVVGFLFGVLFWKFSSPNRTPSATVSDPQVPSWSSTVASMARASAQPDREPPRPAPAPVAEMPVVAEAVADPWAQTIHQALARGQPLVLSVAGQAPITLALRPTSILADHFQVSVGPQGHLPVAVTAWSGRVLSNVPGQPGARATLTLAGPALALVVQDPAGDLHVRRDPVTGALRAGREPLPAGASALAESGPAATVPSTLLDRLAAAGPLCSLETATKGVRPVATTAFAPDTGAHPGLVLDGTADLAPAGPLPPIAELVAGEGSTALDNESAIPFGPAYDASLPDVMLLFVLDKFTTGSSLNPATLAAKAAEFVTLATTVAGVYEEQLGLRLRLQEIVLHPNTAAFTDPGQDLTAFENWTVAHRPFSTFRWSHAARFGLVDGAGAGVIGKAYVGTTGTPYGLSENETNYGFTLFTHELGHSVGSFHTAGGVMNPSLVSNQRNFFRIADGTAVTGAKQISDTMQEPGLTFGSATVRDAAEIPFGTDDFVTTATDTPVALTPLANDFASVPAGAVNTLRLVEVGAVFPRTAGSATLDGAQITFTPAPGFTGVAWFSYTLGGNQGAEGKGWLHRADVQVTVGGVATLPTRPPALSLADDVITYDPADAVIIFNPLLNDEGAGERWAGQVSFGLGPAGADEAWFGTSLALETATVTSGGGTLLRVALPMTTAAASVLRPAGDLIYLPPPGGDVAPVIISYTVRDASGATGTATVTLEPGNFVNAFAVLAAREEDGSAGVFELRANQSAAEDETLSFTVAGSATADTDYFLTGAAAWDSATGIGSVVLPAGATVVTLRVEPVADGIAEADETVQLTITGSSGARPPGVFAEASLPIIDADRSESFTQIFPGGTQAFALAQRSLAFVPHTQRGYRTFLHPGPVTEFPTDPTGGTVLTIGDDAFRSVDFANGRTFPFAGNVHSRVYVGSNGYVTFGSGDTYMVEAPERHFNRLRIAALFDDLDPSAGGTVSHRQLEDRWVLTVENVPEWSLPNASSYQIELFWDGTIRFTWLEVDAGDGLVGLSLTTGGPPPAFVGDDFRWARPRTGLPGLVPTLPGAPSVEAGEASLLSLALRDTPEAAVTVTFGGDAQVTPLTPTIAFAEGANAPAVAGFGAVADGINEGHHIGLVTFVLTSDDPGYDGLAVPAASLALRDPLPLAVAWADPALSAFGLARTDLGLALQAAVALNGEPVGEPVTWQWEVFGPVGATLSTPQAAATDLQFATEGTWLVRARATLNGNTAGRMLAVTVGPSALANAAPELPLAPAPSVTLPTSVAARVAFPASTDATGATALRWSVPKAPPGGFDEATAPAQLSAPSAAATDVLLPQPGPWTLRLEADGPEAVTVFIETAVDALYADLETWQADRFATLPGGVNDPDAGDDADPDGDGVTNLLEFALGLHPLVAQAPTMPALEIDEAELVTVGFRRQRGAGNGNLVDGYEVNGLVYQVEVSSDLLTWRRGSEELAEVGSPVNGEDGTETVSVQSLTSTSVAPQYLRLVVRRAP